MRNAAIAIEKLKEGAIENRGFLILFNNVRSRMLKSLNNSMMSLQEDEAAIHDIKNLILDLQFATSINDLEGIIKEVIVFYNRKGIAT